MLWQRIELSPPVDPALALGTASSSADSDVAAPLSPGEIDALAALPSPGLDVDAVAPPPPVPEALRVPPLELDALRRNDGRVRKLVGSRGLSSHPLMAKGLAESDLIWVMTGAVLDVAEGRSPSGRFPFLTPVSSFSVRGDKGDTQISPESFKRYDTAVDAFVGLNSLETVRLYRQLQPLFDEAYARHGYPQGSFDQALGQAFEVLLDTPVVSAEEALKPHGATRYEFANPALETLEPAQRQLLRMGPRNVERMLDKIADLQRIWQAEVVRE